MTLTEGPSRTARGRRCIRRRRRRTAREWDRVGGRRRTGRRMGGGGAGWGETLENVRGGELGLVEVRGHHELHPRGHDVVAERRLHLRHGLDHRVRQTLALGETARERHPGAGRSRGLARIRRERTARRKRRERRGADAGRKRHAARGERGEDRCRAAHRRRARRCADARDARAPRKSRWRAGTFSKKYRLRTLSTIGHQHSAPIRRLETEGLGSRPPRW